MPRIPISEVPNAVLALSVPPAVNINQVPAIDLSPTTETLLTPTIEQGAFDGPALGLQSLGSGLRRLGAAGRQATEALTHFDGLMQQARNVQAVAQADNLRADYLAQTKQQTASQPPQKWTVTFAEGYGDLEKQIASLPATPEAQTAMAADSANWYSREQLGLKYDATQAQIAQGRQEVLTAYQRNYDAGDFEGADRLMQMAVGSHLFSQEQADQIGEQAQRQQQTQYAATFTQVQPDEMAEEMQRAQNTGASEQFPWMGESDFTKYLREAQTAKVEQTIQRSDALDTALYGGQIHDEREGERLATQAGLSPEEKTQFLRAVYRTSAVTKEEAFEEQQALSETMTDVDRYDPDQDPDGQMYLAVADTIRRQVPVAQRPALFQALQQQRANGRSLEQAAREDVNIRIDNLARDEELGEYIDKDGKVIPDKGLAAVKRAMDLKRQFRAYQAEQPPGTVIETKKWLNDALGIREEPEREVSPALIATAKFVKGVVSTPLVALGYDVSDDWKLTPEERLRRSEERILQIAEMGSDAFNPAASLVQGDGDGHLEVNWEGLGALTANLAAMGFGAWGRKGGKPPKRPERANWDEVQIGDDFNSVKKHLPRNQDAPQMLNLRLKPEEIYKEIVAMLESNPSVKDPDGLSILVANPEGYSSNGLLKRAEHLAASKKDKYKKGPRVYDFDKARWIPNVWRTIDDYGAKINQFNDLAYVRKYRDGTIHIVFVEGNKVVGHDVFDAAVVSQRALDSKVGLEGATIIKKRNLPGAFPIQGKP